MADDLREAVELDASTTDELDSAEAMWTWARTAGVSREELLRTLALAQNDRSGSAVVERRSLAISEPA